jgi:hypothetical protein
LVHAVPASAAAVAVPPPSARIFPRGGATACPVLSAEPSPGTVQQRNGSKKEKQKKSRPRPGSFPGLALLPSLSVS